VRKPLIAGNWKMNKTASEAAPFVRELAQTIASSGSIEVVIAPPFTALEAVRSALGCDSPIQLAGQNLFWEDQGAFTGEISAPMLRDAGCRYVILGHSERRALFGEHDEAILKKLRAALLHGLKPILCVGESLAQRESGETQEVLTRQLHGSLATLPSQDMANLTIAYEPVWAIGTGRAATPDQAIDAHCTIRRFLSSRWSPEVGNATRILYGGSVTPHNIESFMKSDHVDGALVGGACLQVEAFATIAAVAERIGVSRQCSTR
jgi:triosephosphate isomerase (TIM)